MDFYGESAYGISHSHAVVLLGTALAALDDERIEDLSDEALGEDIIAIRRVIDRLEAQSSRRIRVFDGRRGFAAQSGSMVAWMRFACGLTGPAAATRVEVARTLPDLPAAEAAFREGRLGFQQAVALTRVVEHAGVEAVQKNEDVLVDGATRFDAAWVRRVGRYMRDLVDPDAADEDESAEHERRYLHVSPTLDGVVYIEGRVAGDDGAAVLAALDSLMAPRPGDQRTARQRRMDALTEVCRRHLDSGEAPRRGGLGTHVTMTVSIERLRGDRTALLPDLDGVGPSTTSTARRLLCDARVTPVAVDGIGNPLRVGREKRVIPATLRRALNLRDGGCIRCGAPVQWCDGHHLLHWVDGGETTLSNVALLCRPCHGEAHRRRWVMRHGAEGTIEIVDRDGRVMTGRSRQRPPSIRAA